MARIGKGQWALDSRRPGLTGENRGLLREIHHEDHEGHEGDGGGMGGEDQQFSIGIVHRDRDRHRDRNRQDRL